jgi:hypothetical protein
MLRLIGIGSPHGDDQIGWRLFQELAQLRRAAIQTACLPEARLESGNWGYATPLVPFEGPGATGGVLARFGRIGDASDSRLARVGVGGPKRAKRRSASENYRCRGSASPGSNPVAGAELV